MLGAFALVVGLCFQKMPYPQLQYCITIRLPSDENRNGPLRIFSRFGAYDLLKKKKLITIDLSASPQNIKFISKELEHLQPAFDTSMVLEVVFGEKNTYGDFMEMQDQAIINEIKRYVLIDYEFYFFQSTSQTSITGG